ncbi:MAG: amidase [Phycisphaeraceae bacterium]|nr:amidase [Phycisphaeraceae bacterium]
MRSFSTLGLYSVAASMALGASTFTPSASAEIDVMGLTIPQIHAAYTEGTFTATQLTQAYFDQITAFNGVYNAWITLDYDGAMARAAEIDVLIADGVEFTPLFGIPTAIKDPMDTKGLPTTAGSTAFSSTTGGVDIIPGTDAPLVARIREAGAIILGKTNVPDFSRSGTNSTSSLMGATLNAYDITRVPGGSSGGSGVAVATGMATISMAEETGSSITNPASASSLVGVRPTFGLIPGAGVFPLAGTFRDVNGPLTKTVYEAAVFMDVLSGPTYEDYNTLLSVGKIPEGGYAANLTLGALEGARIAVYQTGGWNGVSLDAQTQSLFNQELAVLESLGAVLIDDPFVDTAWASLRTGIPGSGTFSYDIAQYLARLGPDAAFNSVAEYEALTGESWYDIDRMPNETSEANPISRPDLDAYLVRRAEMREFFESIMEEFELDAIVMPQFSRPVPTLESGQGIGRTPGAAVNILGIPGVVVPGGYYDDGTPFPMYFIGDQWDELLLLNLAYDYEQATMHRVSPILVPEPASLALLALGGCALLVRRRTA